MSDESSERPKIIIDEDWKTQVENEREEIREREQTDSGEPSAVDGGEEESLPPASLTFLISTMASQVMAALGKMPDPIEGKPIVRLEFARHYIDMLGVLQEKTDGNTDQEEKQLLEDAVHQLRMLYVAVKTGGPTLPDQP